MNPSPFLSLLQNNTVLVADGATGTNLQARGLPRGMASDVWVLENPEAVMALHADFIAAGSNIILTDTFGATTLRLEHAGLQERADELNLKAVALARKAAEGNHVLVAGSIGPTGQMIQPLGPLSEADAEAVFLQQARMLAQAGVDLFVIETQFDLSEAKAALRAVKSAAADIPVVCSFSYDRGTRTMMGLRPTQVGKEMGELGVAMIGINCGRSLEDNLKCLRELRQTTDLPIWFKPNAGLPRTEGDRVLYDVTPEIMGSQAQAWVTEGARVVGGCCGTSPAHLAAIARAVTAI
jgi:5-methyltetrahydrofolate--homocysteine methyltransferase